MGDFVTNPHRTLAPIGGSQALSELSQAVLDLRAAISGSSGGVAIHLKNGCPNTGVPNVEIGLPETHKGEIWLLISTLGTGSDCIWASLGDNQDPKGYDWILMANGA